MLWHACIWRCLREIELILIAENNRECMIFENVLFFVDAWHADSFYGFVNCLWSSFKQCYLRELFLSNANTSMRNEWIIFLRNISLENITYSNLHGKGNLHTKLKRSWRLASFNLISHELTFTIHRNRIQGTVANICPFSIRFLHRNPFPAFGVVFSDSDGSSKITRSAFISGSFPRRRTKHQQCKVM